MVLSTNNASNFTKLPLHKLSKSESFTLEDYCVTLTSGGDWNMYRDCYSATNSILACNVCEFENTPSFSMKGSCPNGGPNWNYYLTRDMTLPLTYYFEGYKRDMVAPGRDGGWYLYHKSGNKYLTLQSYTDGPVGRRKWTYEDAMKNECFRSTDEADFTFSQCSFRNEFTCDDGSCINKYKRCDDINDCDDASDENNCTIVKLEEDYRRGDPPKLSNNEINYLETTVEIKRIDSIDLNGIMTLTASITIRWRDPRMEFLNIRDKEFSSGDTDNVKEVSSSKRARLWLPLDKIVHENAIIGEIKNGDNYYVRVIARSSELDGDPGASTEDVRYDGSTNLLEMSRDYRIKYKCSFDDFRYPLDTQMCTGVISLPWKNNKTVALKTSADPISMIGPRVLTTFTVMNLSAISERTETGSKFVFTVTLERIWISSFITTFLQTFVLWFLVYLTLFIDVTDFNNRFMGGITGFLVFASLLSSIFGSLPTSAGIKLADIWLLFFMIMIILVIIIHIIIEYQQRQSQSKVTTERFKYPEDLQSKLHASLRSNNFAKILLPIVITLFLVIYVTLSTQEDEALFKI